MHWSIHHHASPFINNAGQRPTICCSIPFHSLLRLALTPLINDSLNRHHSYRSERSQSAPHFWDAWHDDKSSLSSSGCHSWPIVHSIRWQWWRCWRWWPLIHRSRRRTGEAKGFHRFLFNPTNKNKLINRCTFEFYNEWYHLIQSSSSHERKQKILRICESWPNNCIDCIVCSIGDRQWCWMHNYSNSQEEEMEVKQKSKPFNPSPRAWNVNNE